MQNAKKKKQLDLASSVAPFGCRPPLTLLITFVISIRHSSAECYNVLSPFLELFKSHIPLEP